MRYLSLKEQNLFSFKTTSQVRRKLSGPDPLGSVGSNSVATESYTTLSSFPWQLTHHHLDATCGTKSNVFNSLSLLAMPNPSRDLTRPQPKACRFKSKPCPSP